jgi:hypothetical protein
VGARQYNVKLAQRLQVRRRRKHHEAQKVALALNGGVTVFLTVSDWPAPSTGGFGPKRLLLVRCKESLWDPRWLELPKQAFPYVIHEVNGCSLPNGPYPVDAGQTKLIRKDFL